MDTIQGKQFDRMIATQMIQLGGEGGTLLDSSSLEPFARDGS